MKLSATDTEVLIKAEMDYQAWLDGSVSPVESPEAQEICGDLAKTSLTDFHALLDRMYQKYGIEREKWFIVVRGFKNDGRKWERDESLDGTLAARPPWIEQRNQTLFQRLRGKFKG